MKPKTAVSPVLLACEQLTLHHGQTIPLPSTSPLVLVLFFSAWDTLYLFMKSHSPLPFPSHLSGNYTVSDTPLGSRDRKRKMTGPDLSVVAGAAVGGDTFFNKSFNTSKGGAMDSAGEGRLKTTYGREVAVVPHCEGCVGVF